MKKLFALLLVLTLSLTMGSTFALAEEPIQLTIAIRHIGFDSDDDNVISRALDERLGLDVEWIFYPSENYAQNCSLLIASGDYPDAMEYSCATYPIEIQQLADDGIIRPLDELLEKFGSEFTEYVRPADAWYRSTTDGKIYSIPCRNQEFSNQVWQIRQDWLDALGLAVPTNTQELYDVSKAIKANEAQLVGEGKSIVPVGKVQWGGMSIDLLTASEYGMNLNWNKVDDQLVYYVNMPQYREVLRWMRTFYQEGLMEQEWPLLNREQTLEKWYANEYAIFQNGLDNTDPVSHVYMPIYLEAIPEAKLSYIPMFKDANGKGHLDNTATWNQFVIFSDTSDEKAEAIMKLCNFAVSVEGNNLLEMGIEGENWTETNDGSGRANFVAPTTNEEKGELGFYSYNWFMKRNYFPRWNSAEMLNAGAMYAENIEMCPVATSTAAYMENGTVFNDIRDSGIAELVCASDDELGDFDAAFDAWVAEWNEAGGAQWTEEVNANYQALLNAGA